MRRFLPMCRFLLALGLLLVVLPAASLRAAGPEILNADDRSAIKQVIEAQMAAFQKDDAAAFSFATPKIQSRFGDAGRFIAMVKRTYQPVYRPRQVEFSELVGVRGSLAQRVVVVGPENRVFSAYYLMDKQADGAWRIDGCLLRKLGDHAI
jgi:hypothetical protein